MNGWVVGVMNDCGGCGVCSGEDGSSSCGDQLKIYGQELVIYIHGQPLLPELEFPPPLSVPMLVQPSRVSHLTVSVFACQKIQHQTVQRRTPDPEAFNARCWREAHNNIDSASSRPMCCKHTHGEKDREATRWFSRHAMPCPPPTARG